MVHLNRQSSWKRFWECCIEHQQWGFFVSTPGAERMFECLANAFWSINGSILFAAYCKTNRQVQSFKEWAWRILANMSRFHCLDIIFASQLSVQLQWTATSQTRDIVFQGSEGGRALLRPCMHQSPHLCWASHADIKSDYWHQMNLNILRRWFTCSSWIQASGVAWICVGLNREWMNMSSLILRISSPHSCNFKSGCWYFGLTARNLLNGIHYWERGNDLHTHINQACQWWWPFSSRCWRDLSHCHGWMFLFASLVCSEGSDLRVVCGQTSREACHRVTSHVYQARMPLSRTRSHH